MPSICTEDRCSTKRRPIPASKGVLIIWKGEKGSTPSAEAKITILQGPAPHTNCPVPQPQDIHPRKPMDIPHANGAGNLGS